jgi:hypothetical protein
VPSPTAGRAARDPTADFHEGDLLDLAPGTHASSSRTLTDADRPAGACDAQQCYGQHRCGSAVPARSRPFQPFAVSAAQPRGTRWYSRGLQPNRPVKMRENCA